MQYKGRNKEKGITETGGCGVGVVNLMKNAAVLACCNAAGLILWFKADIEVAVKLHEAALPFVALVELLRYKDIVEKSEVR